MNKIIPLLIMCMVILTGCSKSINLPNKPETNIYDPNNIINNDIETFVAKKNYEWSKKEDSIESGIAIFRDPDESLDNISRDLLEKWNIDVIILLTEQKDIHIELANDLNNEANKIAVKKLEQDAYYMLGEYDYSNSVNHMMIELDAIIYGKEKEELPYNIKQEQKEKKISYIIIVNVLVLALITVIIYKRKLNKIGETQ